MDHPTPPLDETFVPAARGSWTFADRDLANHEAWHCAVACALGVHVDEVRIDRPGVDGTRGHCAVRHHDEVWRNAAVSLAPLVATDVVSSKPDLMNADRDLWRASMFY